METTRSTATRATPISMEAEERTPWTAARAATPASGGRRNPTVRLRGLAVAVALIVALLPSGAQARDRYCAGRKATIVGSPGRDRLRGTDHRDVIVGLGGNDTIHGRDGWDIICGGPGRDEVHGDVGDDVLDGDRGSDLLVGDRCNDSLIGDEDADELRGGAGNDRFPAGMDPGGDQIDGGASEDLINM